MCKMRIILAATIMSLLLGLGKTDDLQVGTVVGTQLVFMDQIKLNSIPLTTRNKNVFYNSEKNQVIKGISVVDLDRSKAQAQVTAGGVGSTFVNIRLKSERGEGLNYQVMIFS